MTRVNKSSVFLSESDITILISIILATVSQQAGPELFVFLMVSSIHAAERLAFLNSDDEITRSEVQIC